MFGIRRREKDAGRPTLTGGRFAAQERLDHTGPPLVRARTVEQERADDITSDIGVFELDHPELRMRGWSRPRRPWRSSPLVAAALVAVFTALPQVAPALGAASGTPTDNGTQIAEQLLRGRGVDTTDLRVQPMEDLNLYGYPVLGYVNMFSDDDTISIRPYAGSYENSFASQKGMYADYVTHEYGHVLQKRLIEEASHGGGWAHAAKVAELNTVLAGHSPAPSDDRASTAVAFGGLETDADCIAVTLRGAAGRTAYLGESAGCDAEAMATARSVIEGDWPTDESIHRWSATITAEHAAEADRVSAAAVCHTVVEDGNRHKAC